MTVRVTAESVAAGHPDKVADTISDEILDACLPINPRARVAIETLVTRGRCVIAGEVSGADVDYAEIAHRILADIGYEPTAFERLILVHQQSDEISDAIGRNGEGAGDQGVMFGYATDETPGLMPAPVYFANRLMERLDGLRRQGHWVGPDGKCQLTLEYDGERPLRLHTAVVSLQCSSALGRAELRDKVETSLAETLPQGWLDAETKLVVNGFELGGPAADTGLTGRKIAVDTYGGAAPHGGGAFSGKDPTKVDRSGTYAARYLAKNVVAARLARRCLIEVAYGIGLADPLAMRLDCFGTAVVDEEVIRKNLLGVFSMRPAAIRKALQLERPIYARTASYGHFGREPEQDGGFSWERTSLVDELEALKP